MDTIFMPTVPVSTDPLADHPDLDSISPDLFLNQKRIFVLNGSGGVGKDTFVDYVSSLIPSTHISIVDPVRTLIAETPSLQSRLTSKDESTRRFMSDLKLALERLNDIPMTYVLSEVDSFLASSPHCFLFIDMRESSDISRFLAIHPEAQTILITNKNVPAIDSNPADSDVFNTNYDYIIENNSDFNTLKESITTFCVSVAYDP